MSQNPILKFLISDAALYVYTDKRVGIVSKELRILYKRSRSKVIHQRRRAVYAGKGLCCITTAPVYYIIIYYIITHYLYHINIISGADTILYYIILYYILL